MLSVLTSALEEFEPIEALAASNITEYTANLSGSESESATVPEASVSWSQFPVQKTTCISIAYFLPLIVCSAGAWKWNSCRFHLVKLDVCRLPCSSKVR